MVGEGLWRVGGEDEGNKEEENHNKSWSQG